MAKPPLKATKPEPLAVPHRLVRILLGVICFVAGAAVMVIEISANRLLAPNFGNSLYTWTALIGVILISFSVGGYLGGALADKGKSMGLLGRLLAGAAALTMLIPALNVAMAPGLSKGGVISGPLMISLFLFALPGILLGAISPASVRFYSLAGHDEHVGRAAGTISMLGSLGSFVGTFLSGFVLLSNFGVKTIFIGTGAILLVLAVVAFVLARKSIQTQAVASGVVVLCGVLGVVTEARAGRDVLFKQTSFYHQIEVRQDGGNANRYLQLDSTMEGGMSWPGGELVLDYQEFWKLAQLDDDLKIKRALFIGAGAFGMPEQVSKANPDAIVDVAEIDPAVIQTGRQYFKLDEFPHVHAHAVDARRFVAGSELPDKYDLIFGDAYNGVRQIPAHLVTREFFAQIRSRLTDKGVFLMNVISATEGRRAILLGHIIATLKDVFPNVEVFAVNGPGPEVRNIVLLAANHSWKPWLEDRFYVPNSWQDKLVHVRVAPEFWPPQQRVLTDDWNPIDAVIARQIAASY